MEAETAERNRRLGHDLLMEGARLLSQRRPGEAAAQLEKAAVLLPDDVDIAINLAGAHILQRRYTLAVPILERARDLAPANAMVWVNLAAAYLGRLELSGPQQQQRAIAAYEQALSLDPRAPNVHYNLGLIYKDRKDWPTAQAYFLQALEVDPTDADASYWLDQLAAMERVEGGE
jgi:tetratricopeptide (TPR) repeat protein